MKGGNKEVLDWTYPSAGIIIRARCGEVGSAGRATPYSRLAVAALDRLAGLPLHIPNKM